MTDQPVEQQGVVERLREKAEEHAAFTRPLMQPVQGPWRGYWREAACDLQHALDDALAVIARLQPDQEAAA